MKEDNSKPRRVKAKISRYVTEVAIVLLDCNGDIEEVEDVHEELEYDDCSVHVIHSVLSVHP